MFSVYYKTPRDEALRVLVMIEDQPRRLAALRAFYVGRHDVLDALWWRLHPLETSPRGTPDPAALRDALQRRAFSRQGEASPTVEDHDLLTGADIHLTADELRLRNLDAALEADARALDDAVARFTAAYPASGQQDAAAAPPVHSVESESATRRRPWLSIAVGAVVFALLATTIALALRLQEVSNRVDPVAPAPADPVREWLENNDASVEALLVYTRDQTLDDVYPLNLPVAYDIRAVRQLKPFDRNDGYEVFGVLVEPDQVCLVAVFVDLSSSSACVPHPEFARGGITITTHATFARGEGDVPSTYVSNRITWDPDGLIRSSRGSP